MIEEGVQSHTYVGYVLYEMLNVLFMCRYDTIDTDANWQHEQCIGTYCIHN